MCKIFDWNHEIKTRVAKGVYRWSSRQLVTCDYYHQIIRLIHNSIINLMRNMMITYIYFLCTHIQCLFNFTKLIDKHWWFLNCLFGTEEARVWNDKYTFTHRVLKVLTYLGCNIYHLFFWYVCVCLLDVVCFSSVIVVSICHQVLWLQELVGIYISFVFY